MKVLILNPPFLPSFSRASRSPETSKGGTLYYPLWLAYATGVLEKNGFDVKLLDAPANGLCTDDVVEVAEKFEPNLIVIDTSTPSIFNDINVCEALKKVLPNTFITLVGTHPSAVPEETLRLSRSINGVARREYDVTITELATTLEREGDLKNILGLSYRKGNAVIHNPDRPLITNLDSIPFVSKVYKRHLSINRYFYAHSMHPIVAILAGRGCPYKCTFCLYPQTLTGRAYRVRKAENIVEEMEYITQVFPKVREIMFEDDTLTAIRPRLHEICDKIIKRNLDVTWSCNSRADLDYDTLKKMKRAGCRLLVVGYESGNQNILNNIRKGTNLERMKKFTKNCKKVGILVHGCFILGLPGENRKTIVQTIKFAKELDPDTAQFYPVMVYPGTELYVWAKKNNYLVTEDYSKWLTKEGVHSCVISYPHLSNSDLVEFCDTALKEFYFRFDYLLNKGKQILKHPSETKRLLWAAKTYLKYLLGLFKR